jgi:RNA-binding motif protein, X-linked 2
VLTLCSSPEASWHADYRDTAYIYVGGLPFELSEGDIITIFSQFGEPVHVNLVRDKETGKSRGFAFLKYEDQRSTDLAVDNLGGTTIMGRMLRVDHTRYKRRDDEEIGDDTMALDSELEKGKEVEGEARRNRRTEIGDRHGVGMQMSKEERELAELIRDHDEDDPMKDYLIRTKREEIEAAKSGKHRQTGRDIKKDRHHHRHRSRREGSDNEDHPHRRHRERGHRPSSVDRRGG